MIDKVNKFLNILFWVLLVAFLIFLLIATTIKG